MEIAFILIRLTVAGALVLWLLSPGKAAVFMGVQLGLFGLYRGAAFALNHKGMPIVAKDLSIDFLRRQVLMSRNVEGGPLIDTFLGGLSYQIEHHLFPSMPRTHLRKVAPMVAEFCAERDFAHTETGLWRSLGIVVRYLTQVGLGQRDPFMCPLVTTYQ